MLNVPDLLGLILLFGFDCVHHRLCLEPLTPCLQFSLLANSSTNISDISTSGLHKITVSRPSLYNFLLLVLQVLALKYTIFLAENLPKIIFELNCFKAKSLPLLSHRKI